MPGHDLLTRPHKNSACLVTSITFRVDRFMEIFLYGGLKKACSELSVTSTACNKMWRVHPQFCEWAHATGQIHSDIFVPQKPLNTCLCERNSDFTG
jgi:hypothetical protein